MGEVVAMPYTGHRWVRKDAEMILVEHSKSHRVVGSVPDSPQLLHKPYDFAHMVLLKNEWEDYGECAIQL